jgi:hypothetical protein
MAPLPDRPVAGAGVFGIGPPIIVGALVWRYRR